MTMTALPTLTERDLMDALHMLDLLPEAVGHIPAEVMALLVGTLARRDQAAAELAERMRWVLR